MRERLYEIIEMSDGDDTLSSIYDWSMIAIITLSLVPLAFKTETAFFRNLDHVAAGVFILDYLLRWLTADYKFGKKSVASFLRYPFCFMALVDLISILPSLTVLNKSFKVLRMLRMMRALRVLRAFKFLRYSRSFLIIADVFRRSKESLAAVGTLAITYVILSALVIFNVEPDSFETFFDAVYWATVSLTTVGYGDIYPVTVLGRLVAMLSSAFGIAIVALPSGIITAGYLSELEKERKQTDPEALPMEYKVKL